MAKKLKFDVTGSMSDALNEINADWILDAETRAEELTIHDKLARTAEKGGPGSGHFGHEGRPGKVGGSAPSDGVRGSSISGPESAGRPAERETDDIALLNYIMGPAEAEREALGPDDYFDPAPNYKANVVKTLAEKADIEGIGQDHVNQFIKQWAHSSNDRDYRSLNLQKMASEEFDVPLSDWQQELIDHFEDLRATGREERLPMGGGFEMVLEGKTNTIWEEQLMWGTPQEHDRITRTLLRTMYEETQRELASAGITEVTVYRGVVAPQAWKFNPNDTVMLGAESGLSNAMASWTTEAGVARDFSQSGVGMVLKMTVPASRVLCTPRTGFGALFEFETILLGNENDEALVFGT